MPTLPIRTSFSLRSAFRKAFVLLAFAALMPLPEADAFAPQDSTHLAKTIQRLPGESIFHGAMVANQRIWYAPYHYSGPIRARNFNGDLVFEHTDNAAIPQYGLATSTDGRLYYFYQTNVQYTLRIAIIAPDGTRVGDFGPTGQEAGVFGQGHVRFSEPDIAVSPITGLVYVSDEATGSSLDTSKKGLVRVFDRDGNYLREFRMTGILAPTLEGIVRKLLVHGDSQGEDEVLVIDSGVTVEYGWQKSYIKVFGGDGNFRRLVAGIRDLPHPNFSFAFNGNLFFWKDRLVFAQGWGGGGPNVKVTNAAIEETSAVLGQFSTPGQIIGVDDTAGWIQIEGDGADTQKITTLAYPNFKNFDAAARNAVPNPWVLKVAQRPGSGIVDIDYRVDDLNDGTVTTALMPLADGVASLSNILPLTTFIDGTASRVGTNQPTNQVQRVTWNAGADWNVDFGTLRVMALARDSRTNWFDVNLVEIPADGTRPAVAISRNPLREEDFLAQFFWLVATKDPSVSLVDGVLFGTTGEDNGVILANGTIATAAGRAFLLKRDGLRVATTEEVTRAREGATPGFTVKLIPPLQMRRTTLDGFPDKINEFGIESSGSGNETDRWYVVRSQAN